MTITTPTSEGRPRHPTAAEPQIIQGGMGVAVSGWKLARAVSVTGQLGVVSGTALELVCARRLQSGDVGGHMRRALAAFPVPEIAEWILEAYYVPGGIAPGVLFRPVPRHTIESSLRLLELTVAANFVEVFLAKEGHDGLVGVNYLRKIELPLPAALYGAVLAGVDAVLVGAGSPSEIPELTRRLARHEDVTLDIRVQGARSDDGLGSMGFSPRQVVPLALAPIEVPRVIGIVASADLAAGLAGTPGTRPDGFVVEGPRAGGHNAPPRGPRRVDEIGQPVYDERDEVEVSAILGLGLPVWLAGSYGTPQGLRDALALGAAGVQVGTAFAYSDESGFDEGIKERVRREVSSGDLRVRADWRVSPTGFPFQVADLEGTLSDPAVVSARKPLCDLGVLRSAYVKADGAVDYRCPAEPEAQYRRKGGREANMEGRVCLCNALMASAGLPQRRPNGTVEAPLVTSGGDLRPVAALVARYANPAGGYSAADVVDYLLSA